MSVVLYWMIVAVFGAFTMTDDVIVIMLGWQLIRYLFVLWPFLVEKVS